MFTPPNTLKFYPIFSFKSIDEKEKEKGKIEISSITCVTYDYDNFRLFVGDQRGIIKCFNLKEIFDIVDEYEASKDKDKNSNIIINFDYYITLLTLLIILSYCKDTRNKR